MLHEETLRLVNLVEDVLRLARADAAGKSLNRVQLDITVLIREMLLVFENRFAEKKIDLHHHIPANVPSVVADRVQISRVLRNLLDNAIWYTPKNNDLAIHVASTPSHIQVAMTNKSVDIRQEDVPFIFERFFRGEKSRSREHGGAGIGLAIVKELVEANGGTVGADLKDDRITIWFDLPISNDPSI
jgi:signal transduction histidine kinase